MEEAGEVVTVQVVQQQVAASGCRECSAVQCGQCRSSRGGTTTSRGSSSHRRRERR